MPTTIRVTTISEVAMTPLTPQSQEPAKGSILMRSSTTGTAVQRFYSDGKYHATTGEVYETFADLFVDRAGRAQAVFLLHEPTGA